MPSPPHPHTAAASLQTCGPRPGTHRRTAARSRLAAVAALLVITAAACGSGDVDVSQAPNVDPTASAEELETLGVELVAALEDAGLQSVASAVAEVDITSLIDDRDFTLFAPTDEAFLDVTADELADLLADSDALLALLRNHVLSETLDATDLGFVSEVQSQAGDKLEVWTEDDGSLKVAGATIVSPDTAVADGVVHAIDRILLPE